MKNKNTLQLLLVLLAFGLMSNATKAQSYKIDFEIVDLPDSVAYIGYYLGEKKYVKDTLQVNDGKFSAQGDEDIAPGLYFIYTPTFYREFIVNESNFSFKCHYQGGYDQVELIGSKENTVFRDFQIEMGELQRQLFQRKNALDTLTGSDSIAVVQGIKKIQKEATIYRKKLIEENEGLFIANFLSLMDEVEIPLMDSIENDRDRQVAQYKYYRNNYFNGVDISHPGLVRTPVMKSKMINYFDKVIPQSPDSLIAEMDKLLTAVEDDPESFRFWAVTFFTKYQESNTMGMDKVMVHMIENYYLNGRAKWIVEETKTKLADELRFIKPGLIGNTAPSLILHDLSMNVISPLRDLKSPYLVLFFYDPDCGHCKKKAPILREAYDDLKKLGVGIVAVSTSTDIDKWKKFIEEKEFGPLLNAADTEYRSNFRAEYNVRTTPQVYVLDQDRKVIARKLDVDQLLGFIEAYQKSNVPN